MRTKERFAQLTTGRQVGQSGLSGWVGISVVLSGTTSIPVSTSACRSGSIILSAPLQYANATDSGHVISTLAGSIATGSFVLFTAVAPKTNLAVGWQIIRQ